MKRLIIILISVFAYYLGIAQSSSPTNKAAFGIDGELRAPWVNSTGYPVNLSHDWFSNTTVGPFFGSPIFIIDTTGSKYIRDRYVVDPQFRKSPIFRTMRYPAFSQVSGKLLIDAVWIRDYHNSDSTVFEITNKNGDSPADWTGSEGVGNIPQKNDILDGMVHVRRDGVNADPNDPTQRDSLWFFGGIAIDFNSGNRYFDFELYQTDIFYTRATRSFSGYGPDAGHTSWQFDPATGKVISPGDVIFSAMFGGSGLEALEPRIWVHISALSINSPNFDWGGSFDGSGGTYGYANIKPKDNSELFYSGLQNNADTWAGAFNVVRGDNSVHANYLAGQYLEFSVNMTTLGLDPIDLLGGSACGVPFRRMLIKTRSSSSFTSELKDFIGPFDFFSFDAAEAAPDVPMICGDDMISTISVTNPMPTSTYTWITPDGNIVGDTFGVSITVDTPGTYIVRQQLLAGCGQYATDTITIALDPICELLPDNRTQLSGVLRGTRVNLEFQVSANEYSRYYYLERSLDGSNYVEVKQLNNNGLSGSTTYLTEDEISTLPGNQVYYRIRMVQTDGRTRYSEALALNRGSLNRDGFTINPNPVSERMQVVIPSASGNVLASIKIFNAAGALMSMKKVTLQAGNNVISIDGFHNWSSGIYPVQVEKEGTISTQKMILTRKQ